MKEIWKELNFKGTLYKVSNTGKITNSADKPLVISLDRDGYCRVRLHDVTKTSLDKRIYKTLHRLIFKAFNSDLSIEGLTINHEDGDKLNNNLDNLTLMTFAENNYHAYRTGLKNNKGENHGKARFKESDVLKIRELNKTKTQTEIAQMFNTTQPRISEIIRNKTWNHLI